MSRRSPVSGFTNWRRGSRRQWIALLCGAAGGGAAFAIFHYGFHPLVPLWLNGCLLMLFVVVGIFLVNSIFGLRGEP